MNIKIIVSHNYLPCQSAKDSYAEGKDQYVHIATSSTLKREDFDEWAQKNFTLDTECPKSLPELNFTMCELEALYAGASLPKVKDADYVGLCHYRRLFDLQQVIKCCELMKPDIICAQPAGLGTIGSQVGIKGHYALAHNKDDFELLEGLIKEASPHQQKPETYDIWSRSTVLVAPFNCFVMKKDIFEDYSGRMFRDLVDIWEKRKDDIVKRDNYQRRAIGFLGERFTSWYVTAQHFLGKQVIQLPVNFYPDWKPATASDNRKV